jgi:hypothetical protein
MAQTCGSPQPSRGWRPDAPPESVTPHGELVAVPDRGLLTGNRGVLHDAGGVIVRQAQVRRWITCELAFRGRHRVVMAPGRFTHLFFLDEATALAAGHRPCAECRREDYVRFRDCWATAVGGAGARPPGADALDRVLDGERARVDGRRATVPQDGADLPDGTVVERDGDAWLVSAGHLLRWTPAGYAERRPLPPGPLAVLTPPTTVATIRAGYSPVSPDRPSG